ncbi:MAG: prenyltransferase/squalene oxidase repeat-containing protein, partial [Promethearchaeota archaeon]
MLIIPLASAKPRDSYLVDFIYSEQVGDEGFGNSYQETAQALEILDYFDLFTVEGLFGVENKVDVPTLRDYLDDKLVEMFNDENVNLYDLYSILKSLTYLNYEIDSSLSLDIYRYINTSGLISGGFAPTNTSKAVNVISTFYAFQIYDLLDVEMPNKTIHANWLLSCNKTNGGYGSNSTLSSTLLTTSQVVVLINGLTGSIDNLVNKTATLEYLTSFYISDAADLNNYGGYLPDNTAINVLLSSTLTCLESIGLIDSTEIHQVPTTNMVLSRQNFLDGGFSDKIIGHNQEISSITTSYYAFKILLSFDSLDLLNEEIFMVEFSYIMLLVVLSIIGALALIAYLIWRKRKI